jgi:alpha-glucosidase (family GH31 glycosyl hydrolase)
VLNYPHDPKTWDLGTQYLWGDDLLVAPVTREGATHWTVYLPEGVWHDYWTHAAYQGPCGVTVEAPLERLPLFVRGGAIVPMGPVMQYAGERTLDELTLLIYPRGESVFTLYEDDGETNAWRDGVHVLTNISCTESETGCVIEVDEPRGDAAMIPGNRLYVLRIRAHRTPQTITVDGAGALPRGESAAGSAWWMDGDFAVARVAGNGRTLRVVW